MSFSGFGVWWLEHSCAPVFGCKAGNPPLSISDLAQMTVQEKSNSERFLLGSTLRVVNFPKQFLKVGLELIDG